MTEKSKTQPYPDNIDRLFEDVVDIHPDEDVYITSDGSPVMPIMRDDDCMTFIKKRRKEGRISIPTEGGYAANRVYKGDQKAVYEGIKQAVENGFDGDTYDELFIAAGISHITKNYKDPRTPRRWINPLLPTDIRNKLSRRGRRKKL